MLRLLVVLLALANAGFLVWTLGWLDDATGYRARGDREPERLERQVRPDSIRLLPAGAAAPANAPTPEAPPAEA
ncbi:MAG: SPOR domain-containing protein, partial [Burkholderiaceae bacterium]